MNLRPSAKLSLAIGLFFAFASACLGQAPKSTAATVRGNFTYIDRKILAMAKDFPEEKYDYRMKPEMRSFGEVIVHVTSGIVYAGKAGRGEKASWDEIDDRRFRGHVEIAAGRFIRENRRAMGRRH